MELCNDVNLGLSLLKCDSRLSKYQLTRLLELIGKSLTIGLQSINDTFMDSGELKLAGLALSLVFLEAAKMNKGVTEELSLICMTLQQAEVNQDYVSLIMDKYKEIEKLLKARLIQMKLNDRDEPVNCRKLIDVTWRQDLIIKSKHRNQINEINYLIDLGLQGGNKIGFSADLPGLQDLVYQLKDCCNIVESTFKHIE